MDECDSGYDTNDATNGQDEMSPSRTSISRSAQSPTSLTCADRRHSPAGHAPFASARALRSSSNQVHNPAEIFEGISSALDEVFATENATDFNPFTAPIACYMTLLANSPNMIDFPYCSTVPFDELVIGLRCYYARGVKSRFQIACRQILSFLSSLPRGNQLRPPLRIQNLIICIGRGRIYGPFNRPLSQAALFQNAQARSKGDQMKALAGVDCLVSTPYALAPNPILWGNAYDDLIGTRTCGDGSDVALAYDCGPRAVGAMRFSINGRNGLRRGVEHLHATTQDRHLIDVRQARAIVGLRTGDIDDEITRRVELYPDQWGWLGRFIRNAHWCRGVSCTCEHVSRESERMVAREIVREFANQLEIIDRVREELSEMPTAGTSTLSTHFED